MKTGLAKILIVLVAAVPLCMCGQDDPTFAKAGPENLEVIAIKPSKSDECWGYSVAENLYTSKQQTVKSLILYAYHPMALYGQVKILPTEN